MMNKKVLLCSSLLMLKEKCHQFAKWGYDSEFGCLDEFEESFDDAFEDCIDDFTEDLNQIMEDAN